MYTSSISGTYKKYGVEIEYWSKYDEDGKTMYFQPINQEELYKIKGFRRNKKYGYYTKRTAKAQWELDSLVNIYR